ncbi:NAD(P)-binding domain-containing protein [Paractinoplanes hotanensis]|uniref:NAD(P)-binding domain-containing protein n=1 Tax=Paractinoplanes hotanensis TaxID=2906497 RepID=A0ABT0YG99_9ACTN|nr:NAD(P)-binding domain-containing protein [Actinoplanes hotanensis]MCM4085088.1 NAD(P)-binding domain-containing protein [Actinoplanes hotanensis]
MTASLPRIGWIGLGDQGAPMARAIAEAGYLLHVWARQTSLDALDGIPYQAYRTVAELGSNSDIVGLCLNDDPAAKLRIGLIQRPAGGPQAWRCRQPGLP